MIKKRMKRAELKATQENKGEFCFLLVCYRICFASLRVTVPDFVVGAQFCSSPKNFAFLDFVLSGPRFA